MSCISTPTTSVYSLVSLLLVPLLQIMYINFFVFLCINEWCKEAETPGMCAMFDRFLSCTLCVPLFVSQLFLSSAPRYSSGLSDSPWEAKAIAVIQAIRDKEVITIIRSTNIAICLWLINRLINLSAFHLSIDHFI